ncbi:hypothetical protein [Phenylobacterium immobile]|uniref:hypothetical protein n=1 Tax=Phenylobacterium immobile TaxID=21 RepID=UPI000A9C29CB|nr:hypothetical protein [Phenylobacterium immobile]
MVSGVTYYGWHVCRAFELDISILDPLLMNVLAEGRTPGSPIAKDGCYDRQVRPLMATVMAAGQWHIDYLGLRIRSKPATIKPFSLQLDQLYDRAD